MLILFPELQLWLDVDESREAVVRRRRGRWEIELVEDDGAEGVSIVGIGAGASVFEATRDALAIAAGRTQLARC